MQDDIVIKQCRKACDIAMLRRLDEATHHGPVPRTVDGEPRTFRHDSCARAAENLAAGHGIARDHRGDLLERKVERATQYEDHSFDRREAFQHDQQGKGNVLRLHRGVVVGDDRFRQPLANVGLSTRLLIAQPVEAEARRDGRKDALRDRTASSGCAPWRRTKAFCTMSSASARLPVMR